MRRLPIRKNAGLSASPHHVKLLCHSLSFLYDDDLSVLAQCQTSQVRTLSIRARPYSAACCLVFWMKLSRAVSHNGHRTETDVSPRKFSRHDLLPMAPLRALANEPWVMHGLETRLFL